MNDAMRQSYIDGIVTCYESLTERGIFIPGDAFERVLEGQDLGICLWCREGLNPLANSIHPLEGMQEITDEVLGEGYLCKHCQAARVGE